MTYDTWHMTYDMWHMTQDTGHVTCDRWHVKLNMRWEVNILSKCQLPISYGLWVVAIGRFEEKDHFLNELMNHKGICRPPGLLNSQSSFALWIQNYIPSVPLGPVADGDFFLQFTQLACRGEEEKSGEQIHSHEALAQIYSLRSTGSDPVAQIQLAYFHWLRSTCSDPLAQIHRLLSIGSNPMAQIYLLGSNWLRSTGSYPLAQVHWLRSTCSDLLAQIYWLRPTGSDPQPWSTALAQHMQFLLLISSSAGTQHLKSVTVLQNVPEIHLLNRYRQHRQRAMRPCKIQCTFYCHRVEKIISPLFVYVGKCGVCPEKVGKMAFFSAVNSSGLSSHAYYSLNWKGIEQKLGCSEMLGPLAFRWLD